MESGGAFRRVRRIHADLGWMMQERSSPVGTVRYIGEGRTLVARGAAGFIPEQIPAASGGYSIEAALRRRRSAQSQLIGEQSRELRCDEIRTLRDENADPGISEIPMAAHLP